MARKPVNPFPTGKPTPMASPVVGNPVVAKKTSVKKKAKKVAQPQQSPMGNMPMLKQMLTRKFGK